MKLFLDTNVVLDVLARRLPWMHDAAAILSEIEAGRASGFVAAHSVTTVYYLLAKWQDRKQATRALLDLTSIVRVVAVDHDTVVQALALGWRDFEDAVQAVCALRADVDHLVTRDLEHFKHLSIPATPPAEVLASIRAQAAPPRT